MKALFFTLLYISLTGLPSLALAINEACVGELSSRPKLTAEALNDIRPRKTAQRQALLPLIEEFANVVKSNMSKVPEITEFEVKNIRMSNINPDLEIYSVARLELSEQQSLQRTEPTSALLTYKQVDSGHQEYIRLLGSNRHRSNIYLWRDIHNNSDAVKSVFEYLPTAVGLNPPMEYYKLILTSSVILKMIEGSSTLKSIAATIDESDIDFGRKSAGIWASDGSITKNDYTRLALIEGVVSLHQYLGFLIGSPTEGQSPSEIIEQLLKPDEMGRTLMTKMTQMLPMALVGPLTIKGFSFLRPFKVTNTNAIRPSDEFVSFLRESRDYSIPSRYATCTGCPMVGSGERNSRGGISLLSEAYLMVYQEVSRLVDDSM